MKQIYCAATAAFVMCLSPLVWAEEKLVSPTDLEGGELSGAAVAISNATAVVGAPAEDGGDGAVYVYIKDGGVWVLQQRITASDAATTGAGGTFGAAVSIEGDTLAVGAPGRNGARGAVYVYTRILTAWGNEAIVLGVASAVGDKFGQSVSVDVATLAVGAPFEAVGTKSAQGVTYAFVKPDATWDLQQRIVERRGNARAGDHIGWSVSLAGNTILSGAPDDDFGNKQNRGSIWVYVRNGSIWTRQARLNPGGQTGDRAGSSVALFSNVAVIGADGHKVGANVGQGTAYTYTRTGTNWAKTAPDLVASDGAAGDHFGASVSISGPLKVIGSPSAATGAGKSYLYGTAGADLGQLVASDNSSGDDFGRSVSIGSGRALVGAPGQDSEGSNAGAAYLFDDLVTTTATLITDITPEPSSVNEAYTVSVKVIPTPTAPRVVDVSDGDGAVCSPSITLDSNGEGSCSLTSIAPGLHTISADFGGNDTYSASSDDAPHDVEGGDLAVSKSDGSDTVVKGEVKVYNIVVSNPGDFDATDVQVVDNLPAELLNATWVCTPGTGGTCPVPDNGTGNIDQLVDVDAGGSVTFAVTATVVDPLVALFVENTATINPGANEDVNANNDTATDTDDTILDFIFKDGFEDP